MGIDLMQYTIRKIDQWEIADPKRIMLLLFALLLFLAPENYIKTYFISYEIILMEFGQLLKITQQCKQIKVLGNFVY